MSWALPLILSLLPISLLSIYSYQIASGSVRDLLLAQDLSDTSNLSMLLQQDISKAVTLAEAFASAQGTTRLLQEQDTLGMTTRLKALTLSFPALRSAVIAGADGHASYAYPPDAVKQETDEAFLQNIVKTGKPGVSGLQTSSGSSMVLVAAPVSVSGAIAGAISLEYRVSQIQSWLQNIDLPKGGVLSVMDHRAMIVASSDPRFIGKSYADVEEIRQALSGILTTAEFTDPTIGEKVVSTLLPVSVGRNTWIIMAEKTSASAYKDLQKVRLNIGLAGSALTLVTLLMVMTIARIQSRNARLTHELREKNMRLSETASIVRTTNDAIIGFGRDGKVHTWNDAAERMYGWRREEIVGESVRRLIPPARSDEFATLLTKVNAGETIQNFVSERLKSNGRAIHVSITLSPIRDGKGEIIAVSSIDRDISEQFRMQQMKDDFISFVSHQLKAPVTAMRWTLESVKSGDYGPVPERLEAPLDEVMSVNIENYRLINDILNVSRIDRGVIAVETSPTPLHAIVSRALRDYRVAIGRAGLTLTLQNEGDNILVKADLEKTAEAVTNSISNAIKHTSAGSITIRTYKDGNDGCIDVTDTGEGISKEVIERLFTRSGILGQNTAAEKSAGLGLYIAKHFMELQGGSISVQSEQGKSTTFTYRLPLSNI